MKVNRTISRFMFSRMKGVLKEMYGKHTLRLVKKSRKINKELLGQIKNISSNNPFASRIQMTFPFIALWIASDRNIKPDNLGEIMYKAVDSFRVRRRCRRIDLNNEKHLKKYSLKVKKAEGWAKKHPKDSGSWRFVFDDKLHKEGCYHGVTYCPIADFCKKNDLLEIAPALCKIDYLFVHLYHGVLFREHTIASGDKACDFWVVGDQKLTFVKW